MPAVVPSGSFELLRLYHRVHALIAGERPKEVLVADATDTPNGRRKGDFNVYEQLREDRRQRLTAIVEVLHEHGPLSEDEIVEKLRARRAVTGSS